MVPYTTVTVIGSVVDLDPDPVGSETLSMSNSEKFVRDRAAPDPREREYKGKIYAKKNRKKSCRI
jgi:hypothetical protein